MRHVALLRSVNVAGHGRLKMADLRRAVAALGYTDVATYIQSGNVVFTSASPPDRLRLEKRLSAELGLDTTVMLRTVGELARVLEHTPFPDFDESRLHVGFTTEPVDPGFADDADLCRFAPETAVLAGNHVYLHLPSGMGRAKLPVHLARRLPVPMTIRNWNTVAKLAELGRDGT